jgi:hypothetical protein
MLPELAKFWRQDRLSNVDHLANEGFRLRTKRKIDATFRAEQVSNNRITAAFHAFEQQRRSTFADHASMDLSQLEVWINLGFDGGDFVFSVE